jgi:hypothetical protein
MVVVLAGIDIDADRDPLHNLDVVAGSVFGREEAESGTACATHPFQLPGVFAAIGVDGEARPLAGHHAAELGLFVVGDYPDVIQRNHGK